MYEYISKTTTILNQFNRLFWTTSYQIRKCHSLLVATIIVVIGDLILIIYSSLVNVSLNATCDHYPWLIIYLFPGLILFIEFCYIIVFIAYRLNDNIVMKNDLIGRSLSSMIIFGVVILLRLRLDIPQLAEAIVLVVNYIFWELWFPLFYILFHKNKTRLITVYGSDYDITKLKQIGKEFYCPEYVEFLIHYRLYMVDEDSLLLKDIINKFITLTAIHQLNLTHELRDSVLRFPKEYIHKVNTEVMAIITQNFLPYL